MRADFRREMRRSLPVVTVRDAIDREEHGSDLTGVAVELAIEAVGGLQK